MSRPWDTSIVFADHSGEVQGSDDVGKSLAADRREKAKTKVKSGQGDKGDR
jgi:hypothetical protein